MGVVLGLCGYPGAGKTEVRKILSKNHGFEVINSKAIIYDLAARATNLTENHFSDPELKEGSFEGVAYRKIAAHLGYAIEELFGETYLIEEALRKHKVKTRDNKNFVVDSLRMKQPVMLEDTLTILEVTAKKTDSHIFMPYDRYETPVSKTFTIKNDGTIGDLERQVEIIVRSLSSAGLLA